MRPIPHSRRISLFNADPDQLIRVYTRQHENAWEKAKSVGFFTGSHGIKDDNLDPGYGYSTIYEKQYFWIRDRMADTVTDFTGDLPMWAYLKRPIHKGWWKLESPMIQFTALVPRKRILFSDYENWHLALNDWPMYDTEDEVDSWWEQRPRPDPSHTWHRCLDICGNDKSGSELYRPSNQIQACIDRIYIDEIVDVKYPK